MMMAGGSDGLTRSFAVPQKGPRGGSGFLMGEGVDGGEEGFAGGKIEAGGGFIEEEEFRLADQGAGDEGAAAGRVAGEGGVELGGAVGEADAEVRV